MQFDIVVEKPTFPIHALLLRHWLIGHAELIDKALERNRLICDHAIEDEPAFLGADLLLDGPLP